MSKEGAGEGEGAAAKKVEEERKAREAQEKARAEEEEKERRRKAAEEAAKAPNQQSQPISTATKPAVIKLIDKPTTLGHFKDDYNKLRASYDAEVTNLTPQQKELLAPEIARQEARFENITQQRLLQAEIASTQDPAQKNELQAKVNELFTINLQMNEIYNRAFAAAGARGGGPVEYSLGDQKQLRDLQTKQHKLISPVQMKAVQDAQLDNATMPAAWTAPTEKDQKEANSKLAAPPTNLTIGGLQKIPDCPAGIQLRAETHQGTVVSCASRKEAEKFAKKFRANVSVEPDKQNNGRFVFIISHKTAKAIANHSNGADWISMDERDKRAANGATAQSQSPQAAPSVTQPSPNAIVANANAASPSSQPQKQKPGQLTSDQVRVINEGVIGVEHAQVNKPVVYFEDKARAEAFAKEVFGEKPPPAQSATHQTNPGLPMYSVALDPETAKAIMEHATNLGAEEKAEGAFNAAKIKAVDAGSLVYTNTESLEPLQKASTEANEALKTARAVATEAQTKAEGTTATDKEKKAATDARAEVTKLEATANEAAGKLATAQKRLDETTKQEQEAKAEVQKLQADLSAAAEKTADAKATGFIPMDKRKEMEASKVDIQEKVDLAKATVASLETAAQDASSKASSAGAGAQPAALAEDPPNLKALKEAVAELAKAETDANTKQEAFKTAKKAMEDEAQKAMDHDGLSELLGNSPNQLHATKAAHEEATKALATAQNNLADSKFAVKLAMDAHTNPPTHQLSEGAKAIANQTVQAATKDKNEANTQRNAAQTPKAIELAQHKLNKAEQAFAVATQANERGLATPAEALKLEQQALDAAIAKTAEAQSALVALKPKAAEVALGVDGAAAPLEPKAGALAASLHAPEQEDQTELITKFIAAERALLAEQSAAKSASPVVDSAAAPQAVAKPPPTGLELARDVAKKTLKTAMLVKDLGRFREVGQSIEALQTALKAQVAAEGHVARAQEASGVKVVQTVQTQASAAQTSVAPLTAAVTEAKSLAAPAAPAAAAIPDPLKLSAIELRFQKLVGLEKAAAQLGQNGGFDLAKKEAFKDAQEAIEKAFTPKEREVYKQILDTKAAIAEAQEEKKAAKKAANDQVDKISAAQGKMDASKAAVQKAREAKAAAKTALDSAKAEEKSTKKALGKAQASFNKAVKKAQDPTNVFGSMVSAKESGTRTVALASAKAALGQAQAAHDAATSALYAANAKFDDAKKSKASVKSTDKATDAEQKQEIGAARGKLKELSPFKSGLIAKFKKAAAAEVDLIGKLAKLRDEAANLAKTKAENLTKTHVKDKEELTKTTEQKTQKEAAIEAMKAAAAAMAPQPVASPDAADPNAQVPQSLQLQKATDQAKALTTSIDRKNAAMTATIAALEQVSKTQEAATAASTQTTEEQHKIKTAAQKMVDQLRASGFGGVAKSAPSSLSPSSTSVAKGESHGVGGALVNR